MDEQEGVPGVLRRFQEIGATRGEIWEGNFEGENLIGLQNQEGASITIEPGGQIELSDQPMDHLSQVETSIRNFVRDLKESIRSIHGRLLFLGAQPLLIWMRSLFLQKNVTASCTGTCQKLGHSVSG